MITLGLKIGFVAFVACITFAALTILLITAIASFGRNYDRRKEKSDKVTPMPRRDD